ncbi:ABC transporter permease subunit [Spiroplasma endosymbiont of Agriotes lineatus]|uniref:ABC transporter permease subunit n=1 Tax=Spiroplasma endosymbiont of Agriotes lineatus TaxID=3077930 RepID=UPI0030D09014
MIKKIFKSSYLLLVLLFIYVPISILIFYSFNNERSLTHFNGNFSLTWYEKFFQDRLFVESIISSLLVAVISTIVSVIIGTLAAIGISKAKKITQSLTLNISNIPLINADVVTAVSLMMLFMALGFNFGLFSLILGHISFNIPYAIITVLPRLKRVHPSIIEASLDLGASPRYTLRKVILPLIWPAIVAASVISFAMSFDDFIISYFTGGNVTNVATYIYTLKRLTPVVNAFGTILISIVAILVLSWNCYTIVSKQIKSRNHKILTEKYRDKIIINSERKLLQLYLQLNNLNLVKNLNILKLKRKIFHLEIKVDKEKLWIKSKKAQIIRRDKRQERISEKRREKYYWLVCWPWRAIIIMTLSFTSLGALTFVYVQNNLYDFKLGIWGEYINSSVVKKFETAYNIKMKVETYDKNEVLYNKMFTTDYDVIVPSDYMASRLIVEDKVEKLDWSRLMPIDNAQVSSGNSCSDLDGTKPADNLWTYLDCGIKKVISVPGYKTEKGLLSDYAVPYFWGDLTILLNFEKPETKNWLIKKGVEILTTNDEKKEEYLNPTTVSWELIWQAAREGKNVFALSDFRSLYGLAFQRINQTVNPERKEDVEFATKLLKELIVNYKNNVTLQSDEIVNSLSAPYDPNSSRLFDIAVMYNGDAVASFYDKNQNIRDRNFKSVRPRKAIPKIDTTTGISNMDVLTPQGTNVWADVAMITKHSTNKDLAYKFLQFVLQDKVQTELSLEFGYNMSLFKATQDIINDEYKTVDSIYLPVANFINGKWVTDIQIADAGFQNKFIKDITDSYTRIISAGLGGY